MIKNFYRKLYFYALGVIVAAIILTSSVTSLIMRFDERKNFNDHLMNQIKLIQVFMSDTPSDNLAELNKKISKASKALDWEIIYFNNINDLKPLVPEKRFNKFLHEGTPTFIRNRGPEPTAIMYLDSSHKEKGLLMVKAGPPPHRRGIDPFVISSVFILIFLAILLIPYSQYVIRPFKNLMISIESISSGNFSNVIKVSEKNDFKAIANAFNNMIFKIQEMLNQRDRLIADVSHELRTPLTRIRLGLELLDKEDKGNKKYINKAINEIEQLDELIDSILDSSKFEYEKVSFNSEILSFKDFILENLEKNQILFAKQNLKIKTDLADKDLKVKIDKTLFNRALSNIFSNLVKYAPYGSEVDIKLQMKDKNAYLCIRNSGEEISDIDYERIFEPFYRTDDSRSRETGGTGLGLAIVKKIIGLHEGNIWASRPNDNHGGLVINIELKAV